MAKRAFILGVFATGGQVLLLRELIAAFGGSELLIGTALFGWLVWVALAAMLVGRTLRQVPTNTVFAIGAIVLPVSIVVVRFCPVWIVGVAGETVPFVEAALVSVLIVGPVGSVSGALFSLIARSGAEANDSVVRAYLFEGIGAFSAGLLIPMLTVIGVSTFGASLMVGIVVYGGVIYALRLRRLPTVGNMFAAVMLLALIVLFSPNVDRHLDRLKYKDYDVRASFDTRYSHQTLLQRDSTYVLMTDNTIEATCPDEEAAEYTLVPPLIYRPDAKEILIVGRTEFGLDQPGVGMNDLRLAAVDPRERLTDVLAEFGIGEGGATVVHDDPLAYLEHPSYLRSFDILVLNLGQPDNYRTARFLTVHFFQRLRNVLWPNGLLYFQTDYDTERYVSDETRRTVAAIYHSLKASFEYIEVWPGPATLFFASDSAIFDLDLPSIDQRVNSLGFEPRYVQSYYLADRLSPLKLDRLMDAIDQDTLINTLNRPRLVHLQAVHRARMVGSDAVVLSLILDHPVGGAVVPAAVVLILMASLLWKNRKRRIGLWLYFVAGAVSLSLELLSFYVYQSLSGSLFNELASLIGTFMLGLAVGTYLSYRRIVPDIDRLALLMLLVGVLIFGFTWDQVPSRLVLVYHVFFLFSMAVATGSLFVGATIKYYAIGHAFNRGTGYAVELAGSALSALIVIPVLLPAIGLNVILIGLAALIVLTWLASIIVDRQ